MTPTEAKVLPLALSILEPGEDRWVKGVSAAVREDNRFRGVTLHSTRATCYCLTGAIRLASTRLGLGDPGRGNLEIQMPYILHVVAAIKELMGKPMSPINFNDSSETSYENVMWVLRKAIELQGTENVLTEQIPLAPDSQ